MPLGLPAFFRAIPSAADSKTRYRFNFGDASSPTEWTATPDLIYTYAAPGAYTAFVEIGLEGDRGIDIVATSATKRVRIAPIGPPDNSNGNINLNPPDNTNLNTPANTNPNANLITNGNVNSNGNGNTNSNVFGNTNGNVISEKSSSSASSSETLSPTPIAAPTESSNDWWKYLIIIAIILFAGYQAASYLIVPRPTFVPHIDPGDADAGAGLAIDLQVDVDPNVTGGEFTLNTGGGSLIKSERTES